MNHLKPIEIFEATVNAGVMKANSSFKKLLILGILAGGYIAFAGAAAAMGTFNLIAEPTTFGLGKILSGTIFAAGLVVVVLAGAELFTGNSLITAAVLEKKTTVSKMLRNWVIVYIANFIGSILVTWMIWKIGLFGSGADMFGAITVKVAVGKVNMTFVNCLLSGIMCNWLVSLAVWMATGADSTIGKIFAIFFPIWMFVTCGFEHCIANMYAIPAGILASSNPAFVELSGVTAEALSNLTWAGMAINNLVPATIGNIIGGGFFVATMYWLGLKKS